MERVKRKIDFTEGKVFSKIVWFILPIVATNLLQTFYNAADMMVVSLSSEKMLSAPLVRQVPLLTSSSIFLSDFPLARTLL